MPHKELLYEFQKHLFYFQYPALFLGEKNIADEKRNHIHDAFILMENFLEGRKWFCGDNMTIADLSILASVSSIIVKIYFIFFLLTLKFLLTKKN